MVDVAIIAFASPEYKRCLEIRDAVLRVPLGLSLGPADTGGEAEQLHFMATLAGRPCATCCLRPEEDGRFQLRQMAVNPECRGKGVGAALLHKVEAYAAGSGGRLIWMEARAEVMDFYRKSGYLAEGKPYMKMDIPHVRMIKELLDS